jgi:cadmium resistance protein CadD (predicted permease)
VIGSAVGAFFATNIDAFVALSVLFATTEDAVQTRTVFLSALAGFAVLLVVSVLGAAGLEVIPRHGAAWLGLAPVAVGVFRLYEWFRAPRNVETAITGERVTACSGTFVLILATGGDNIAAYIPLFHQFGSAAALLVAAAYFAGFAVICLMALGFSANAALHRAVHRIAQPLGAALFIGIGCSVIVRGLQ